MSKQAWFVPKAYGIGYSPGSWQGWLATAIFILITVGGSKAITAFSHVPPGPWAIILALTWVAISTGVFLLLIRSRAEGDMRWRWGRD